VLLVSNQKFFENSFIQVQNLPIISVNGKMVTSYDVHKSILMGRSEVLAAMLSKNDMSENKTNSTIISDIGPEPLKEMIHFLYTDQVTFILFWIAIN
jgi:hypothetical protein